MIGLRSGMGASGLLQDLQSTQKRSTVLSTTSLGDVLHLTHHHLQQINSLGQPLAYMAEQAEFQIAEKHVQCCLCRG